MSSPTKIEPVKKVLMIVLDDKESNAYVLTPKDDIRISWESQQITTLFQTATDYTPFYVGVLDRAELDSVDIIKMSRDMVRARNRIMEVLNEG